MPRTLGLDIGTNSIGWALLDTASIVGIGVRVFPEGVARDQQGGEHSKNEQRRIARGMRRQIARRSRRKALLRRALVEAGLYPADPDAQRKLDQLDPYELRDRAMRERIEPFEIGRILIHLNQRRGFLSNRKADRARKREDSELIQEMSDLAREMGGRTLGQHLAQARASDRHKRVRGLHTRRDFFIDEFERIWAFQKKHHPQLLTETLKTGKEGAREYPRKPQPLKNRARNSILSEYGLHGILFFQRSMYWPKSALGACELEPKEKRCRWADRAAQRFRILQDVNNLRVIDNRGLSRNLTSEERKTVLDLLSKKRELLFDDIRKRLSLNEAHSFNLERGERRKLKGMETDVLLARKGFFGPAWHKRPNEEKDAIVRSLLDDEEHEIRQKASRDWGCSEDVVERLVDLNLPEGHASYSRLAIDRLLPHLERGLLLMGNDATDSARHAAGYLRPDEHVVNQRDSLPRVPDDITNPLVLQALHEVRKLVNAIIREYGIPAAIHIELARELRGSLRQRQEYARRNRDRERRREEAKEAIRSWGQEPKGDAVLRYLLWQEQGEMCLYSGRAISMRQLLGGEVNIDHILPLPRSLDNSFMNKVVCFRDENAAKGDRTPHEWLADANPAKYEAILQRAGKLPLDVRNSKRLKIAAKDLQLEEFINRQLTDTAYITSKVRAYLRCLGTDVVCTKGQCTAELRHMWGLNGVLRDDGLNLKNREDHRHHAVDALVVGLTTRSRLHQLARARGSEGQLAPPWETFWKDTEAAINSIYVSHRAERRIHEALHEETIYGATAQPHRATDKPRPHAKGWVEEQDVYVYRKELKSLQGPEIDKIRDVRLRELVKARLRAHSIDPSRVKVIPKSVWVEPLRMVGLRGADHSPNAPIIRKVRLTKTDGTILPIRTASRIAFVKPGNTHHICLFAMPGDTDAKPRREVVPVTMLEAAARVKRGEPIIQRTHPEEPGARFLFSLSSGETVLGSIGGREDLYCYRFTGFRTRQMTFITHRDARPRKLSEEFRARANTLKAVKVTVDLLGRLRRARD